jgi:hypothetical protein
VLLWHLSTNKLNFNTVETAISDCMKYGILNCKTKGQLHPANSKDGGGAYHPLQLLRLLHQLLLETVILFQLKRHRIVS